MALHSSTNPSQVNTISGVCREIKRIAGSDDAPAAPASPGAPAPAPTQAPTSAPAPAPGPAPAPTAQLYPPFVSELTPRVLLMAQRGDLVQVNRLKTTQGVDWCYGIVVCHAEVEEDGDMVNSVAKSKHDFLSSSQNDSIDSHDTEINGCELRRQGASIGFHTNANALDLHLIALIQPV